MSAETLSVLVGGPGLVALVVAIIGFLQNRRTLSASQPKSEAERMAIDINSLRSLLAEERAARQADRSDFQYRIAEVKAEMKAQEERYERKINLLLDRIEEYLREHAIGKPSWWPRRHSDRPTDLHDES